MSNPGDSPILYDEASGKYLFWDHNFQQYYWYDRSSDQLVYQDKQRRPRPADIPRSFYDYPYGESGGGNFTLRRRQALPNQLPPHDYSTSPPSASGSTYRYGSNASGPSSSGTARQMHPREQSSDPVNIITQHLQAATMDSRPNQFAVRPSSDRRTGSISSQRHPETPTPPAIAPHVLDQGGIRVVTTHDPRTHVRTAIATAPSHRITDGALLRHGISATRMMMATRGDSERLWPGFSVRKPSFYVRGRVFLTLWVEPAGESSTKTLITSLERSEVPGLSTQAITTGRFDERVFSKVRRFVVIREGKNFCSALPIVSYGKQGVGKRDVVKSDHAIIYTGGQVPVPIASELPSRGEDGMRPRPICVVSDNGDRDRLDPMSRIDFAKVHTIQHNLKVKPFGMVHPRSTDALMSQFKNVWNVLTEGNERSALSSAPARSQAEDAEDDDDRAGNDNESSSESSDGEETSSVPQRAIEVTDAQGRQAVDAMARMRAQGYTRDQAFIVLVNKIHESQPGSKRATAVGHAKALLARGQEVQLRAATSATAGATAARRGDKNEEHEEDDEDDQDDDDDDEDEDEDDEQDD